METDQAAVNVIPVGTQTLARGLDVLAAVNQGAVTLGQITQVTGLGKSTVHRLLQLLTRRDYLSESEMHRYRLGPRLIELGAKALADNPLTDVVRPILEAASEQLQDSMHLGTRDDGQVLYLCKTEGSRGAQMRSRVGGRMPLSRTGIGMALLLDDSENSWRHYFEVESSVGNVSSGSVETFISRMQQYRSQGACMDLEDNEIGIRCVAVPIRGADSHIVAAISISATSQFMPQVRMKKLVKIMKTIASNIDQKLGYYCTEDC